MDEGTQKTETEQLNWKYNLPLTAMFGKSEKGNKTDFKELMKNNYKFIF